MTEVGHKQLRVWQKGMDLAVEIYRVTLAFPGEERYGLVSQMRRAAVSIPSNVAEGYGRGGKDYARFVAMAYGSLLELETQLDLANRFKYVDDASLTSILSLCSEVGKMLNRLRTSLQDSGFRGQGSAERTPSADEH